jgi:hypothetical protein
MMRFEKARRLCSVWLLAAALSALATALAFAQSPAPSANAVGPATPSGPEQPAAIAPPALPPQPPPVKRGFLDKAQDWWHDSVSYFGSKVEAARGTLGDINQTSTDAARSAAKSAADVTQDAMKSAAAATKDAASAVARLPATRVFEIRQKCPKAANGAPDCPTAATDACRAKGFSTGKPLDISTAQACPPAAYLSGQMPAAGECPEETVVLRAICQ